MHVAPLHLRLVLDDGNVLQVVGQSFENGEALLGVGHLAAAEHDGDLHLVAGLQKAQHVLLLGGVVAHVDLRPELHFLNLDLVLVLTSLLGLDGLVVLELPIVHDAAYGRRGVRSDLHQIEIHVVGDLLGLVRGVHAHLVPVEIDETALARDDLVVEPGLLSSYRAHLPFVFSHIKTRRANKAHGGLTRKVSICGYPSAALKGAEPGGELSPSLD